MDNVIQAAIYVAGIVLVLYASIYAWQIQMPYIKRHGKIEKNLLAVKYANVFLLLVFSFKLIALFYGVELQLATDVALFIAVLSLIALMFFLKDTPLKIPRE